jgi:predicted RNA-binding Zn ribbon-like protein
MTGVGDELNFRFLGGRPSVDFTATVGMRWRDGGFERLPDAAALERWFTEAGLSDRGPQCSPADLRHARQLREAVHRLMLARMGRARTHTDDVDTVNAWAAKSPPALRLHRTRTGLEAQVRGATAGNLLAQVARDAVDVIGGPDGERLRECDNPQCSLLFVDTSRARARRWCSMSSCGSRDKMARLRSQGS